MLFVGMLITQLLFSSLFLALDCSQTIKYMKKIINTRPKTVRDNKLRRPRRRENEPFWKEVAQNIRKEKDLISPGIYDFANEEY